MAGEALAAALVGIAALWLVLQPLVRPGASPPLPFEPLDPEETAKGLALAALKEIEFDRETGKLSDDDYEFLKVKYTVAAVEALREEQVALVSTDVEALVAARVRSLQSAPTLPARQYCDRCGAGLVPDGRFCESCGRPVAA
jgi:hypothetical protein